MKAANIPLITFTSAWHERVPHISNQVCCNVRRHKLQLRNGQSLVHNCMYCCTYSILACISEDEWLSYRFPGPVTQQVCSQASCDSKMLKETHHYLLFNNYSLWWRWIAVDIVPRTRKWSILSVLLHSCHPKIWYVYLSVLSDWLYCATDQITKQNPQAFYLIKKMLLKK